MTADTIKVNCMACRHFYVTYEPAHPYGCRALAFKAKEMPSRVVFISSGMECRSFFAKVVVKKG
jgi:hypothetical protein